MSLLALLYSFVSIALATPESCTTIDFRDRVGPIKNQLDTPWCFAFSTADLASFASGKDVSPYPIALSYHNGIKPVKNACGERLSEGGYQNLAFNYVNQFGFCTEDQVSSINKKIATDKSAIHELYKLQQNLIRFREIIFDECQDIPGTLNYDLALNSANNNLHLFSPQVFRNMFPNSNIEDIVDALAHSSLFQYPEGALARLADLNCKMKLPYKALATVPTVDQVSNIDSELNKILENGEIASLGVNLSPHISLTNLQQYISSQKVSDDLLQQQLCEANVLKDANTFLHAVTLVGRKYNTTTKNCEYIVKNSWGTNCSEKSMIVPKLNCQDGYLFLSKSEIAQMIKTITTLQKN